MRSWLEAGVAAFSWMPGCVAALTGTELQARCSAKEGTVQDLACMSYLVGHAEGMAAGFAASAARATYCPPAGLTPRQIQQIVLKHLREVPEDLHHGASDHVGAALLVAYPCKRN